MATLYGYIRTSRRLIVGEPGNDPDTQRRQLMDAGVPTTTLYQAKSPSLLDVWKSRAVRQLRRYQEAGPEWAGSGAPELSQPGK